MLKASLNDDARVIIYNRHMFIVQTTGVDIFLSVQAPSIPLGHPGTVFITLQFISNLQMGPIS
jgi:hypothetical protein